MKKKTRNVLLLFYMVAYNQIGLFLLRLGSSRIL